MDGGSTMVLSVALIIIMFGMGLSLTLEDFKRIAVRPVPVLIGIINQLILLPVIAYLLCCLFSPSLEIIVGVMILAACPGGPTSNMITYLAKGDTALSVSLTAINSFITVFTIPIIVNLTFSQFAEESKSISLDIVGTILEMLKIVIVPIIVGMLINRRARAFALKMNKPVRIFSGVLFVVIIVGVILKERAHLVDYFAEAGLITLLLNIATIVVGYATANLFLKDSKQSVTISIESSIQNGTLGITIAIVLLQNPDFAIAPAVYSVIMFLTSALLIAYGIRKTKAPKYAL